VIEARRNGALVPFLDPAAAAEAVVARLSRKPGREPEHGHEARATVASRFDKRNCLRSALGMIGLDKLTPARAPTSAYALELAS